MWNCCAGDNRCLKGVERTLFLHGLWFVLEQYTDGMILFGDARQNIARIEAGEEQDWFEEFARPVFGHLEPKHKIIVLAEVAKALVEPSVSAPDLFAWNEAAVWVIYQGLLQAVAMEMDAEADLGPEPHRYQYRQVISTAFNEIIDTSEDDDGPLVQAEKDKERWEYCIGQLSELILWDEDFLIEGINSGYDGEQPPALTEKKFRESLDYLMRLTDEVSGQ